MIVKGRKKVFVSGCFDLLHSGHVAFFKEASQFGDLYVGLGSDSTIEALKGRKTFNSELERLYLVKAIRYVSDAGINSGDGILDFEGDLDRLNPDYFVVNEDGHTPGKEALCERLGIRYKVLERVPAAGLDTRSTTILRQGPINQLPYRIDLAGTWGDQPYVNSLLPCSCITVSIEPTMEFNERSGMSTSTRKRAFELWGSSMPLGHPIKLAETLFRFDNEPGKTEISGAQDSIGIAVPGMCYFTFDKNSYWPSELVVHEDEAILDWLEEHIYMVTLWPRKDSYDATGNSNITVENVRKLTTAAQDCYSAILARDTEAFAKALLESFEAQTTLFPKTIDQEIEAIIDSYRDKALAWKLSGAGGGGYLILVSEQRIPNAIRIKIRRRADY